MKKEKKYIIYAAGNQKTAAYSHTKRPLVIIVGSKEILRGIFGR